MPVHEALLVEIYQVQSAIGRMTGKPEVMPPEGTDNALLVIDGPPPGFFCNRSFCNYTKVVQIFI